MKDSAIKYLQKALGVEQDGDIGPITRKAYADKLLSIAERELGVSEIGHTNSGKRVKEYQAATDLGGSGWPWCAAYVCWVIQQAKIFSNANRPRTAAAYGFEEWADKIGMNVIKSPYAVNRGDICVFKFSHIGFAKTGSDYDGDFETYEGNTNTKGEREGGSVLQKVRNIGSVRSVIRL